jgi:hypothetical protein
MAKHFINVFNVLFTVSPAVSPTACSTGGSLLLLLHWLLCLPVLLLQVLCGHSTWN